MKRGRLVGSVAAGSSRTLPEIRTGAPVFRRNIHALAFAMCALIAMTACQASPDVAGDAAAANPYDRFAMLMAARDVDGMVALFAEDATYRDRTFDFEVTGHDAIRAVLLSTIEGFGGPSLETRRVVVSGNHVAIEWILRGTFAAPILGVAPDSGAIELEGVTFGVVENGLIRDHTDYLDRAALATRLGMEP